MMEPRFQKCASLCSAFSLTYVVSVSNRYHSFQRRANNGQAENRHRRRQHPPRTVCRQPAEWIENIAKARGDIDVEVLDLRDYPLPFFDEAVSPAYGPSKNEVAQKWQKKVAELDGFIFTGAEYNRGPTAVLKNALDYAYNEWNKKAVTFVGYGGVGGARAVEQLRLNAVELQMAPTGPASISSGRISWPSAGKARSSRSSSTSTRAPATCSTSSSGGPRR